MADHMSILDKMNKTTIPKGIRLQKELKPGTSLYWQVADDGNIVVTPLRVGDVKEVVRDE